MLKFFSYLKIFLILTTGTFYIIYSDIHYNNIYQGIYLDNVKIKKINIGLTSKQVINLIGRPNIIDPFKEKRWFYIYYKYNNFIKSNQLILTFNKKNILIKIDKVNY